MAGDERGGIHFPIWVGASGDYVGGETNGSVAFSIGEVVEASPDGSPLLNAQVCVEHLELSAARAVFLTVAALTELHDFLATDTAVDREYVFGDIDHSFLLSIKGPQRGVYWISTQIALCGLVHTTEVHSDRPWDSAPNGGSLGIHIRGALMDVDHANTSRRALAGVLLRAGSQSQ